MPILIASNSSSCVTCLNRSSKAFIYDSSGNLSVPLEPLHVDVDAEGPYFLHEHVERLRHARVDLVIALADVLVDLGPAVDVVGLDREHLLQRVRRAVRLERPHFHLAEALAAELRLAAERLLRDERVRSGRAGVHL